MGRPPRDLDVVIPLDEPTAAVAVGSKAVAPCPAGGLHDERLFTRPLGPSTFGFFLRAGPQCVLARSTRSRGRHCAAYNRRRRRARPASQGWALLQLPYAPVVQIAPATRSSIPQNRLVQPKPHTNNKRASPPTRLSCARLADDHTTDGEQPSTPSLDRPLLDVRARARAHACLLYTSPSPRDPKTSRMPSSA